MIKFEKGLSKVFTLTVFVAALGYFVDIFDLFLFGVVRIPSLKDLGVPENQLHETGLLLLNRQMLGVLLGGIFWGILGDKRGRVSVLFGSIFLYSTANFANGFVTSIDAYALLRLIAGFGLAGELGVAVTLVSESLSKKNRGYGTTIVATVGLLGSVAAALVSERFHWRTAYMIGGVLGFALLFLRIRVHDSSLFETLKLSPISRGNLFMLFFKRERFLKYIFLILVGVPIWFTIGIIITFSPEFAKAIHVLEPVSTGSAIFYTYIGVAFGDLASGLGSQFLKKRRTVVAGFLVLLSTSLSILLLSRGMTSSGYYWSCVVIGFATGYWAVLMTMAAEQIGTNLRSTVTSTVPNFVRGSVVPIAFLFQFARKSYDIISATFYLGTFIFLAAFIALYLLKETFESDLDFVEK